MAQVLWSDIDYMDGFRDFTLNPVAYAAPKMQARPASAGRRARCSLFLQVRKGAMLIMFNKTCEAARLLELPRWAQGCPAVTSGGWLRLGADVCTPRPWLLALLGVCHTYRDLLAVSLDRCSLV